MQLEVDFNFIHQEINEDIDNNTQYTIRQMVVEILRESGYGEIIDEDGGFINEFVRPFVFGYIDEGQHELLIGYIFNINNDETHGNIAYLLTNGISNLYNRVMNQLQNIRVFVRTTYFTE